MKIICVGRNYADHIEELKNDSLFNHFKQEELKNIKIQSSYIINEVYSKGLLEENFNFKDFDEDSLEKSCTFGVTDARKLPFRDSSFDYVICSEVLEHIIEFEEVIEEINRILKPGGVFSASVPKFFPEWICWKLSKDYQNEPGGHVRIFKYKKLKEDVKSLGFEFKKRHWAHALHSPYWWMRCLFWRTKEKSFLIKSYHSFLVWDMTKNPLITKILEYLLQPFIGKSVVMYFENKEN